MRVVNIEKDDEALIFAKKAAQAFIDNPKWKTYGDFKSGCFFALTFGLDNDGVVVLKIDKFFEPINYQYLINHVIDENLK